MFLQYGSHKHAAGEIEFARDVETLFLDSQIPYAERHRWTLQGTLFGSSTDDLDQQVQKLEADYRLPGKDLVLYKNSGAPTALRLLSQGSLDGVKVVSPPSFPSNRGAAYVTLLPYRIVLEAEYPVDGATQIVSFRESVQRAGGGPIVNVLETLEAPPVFQQGKLFPAYRAIQSGEAIGLYATPSIPPPLWPDKLVRPVQTSEGSGERRGQAVLRWPISWSYEFASATPFFGKPHVAGVTY